MVTWGMPLIVIGVIVFLIGFTEIVKKKDMVKGIGVVLAIVGVFVLLSTPSTVSQTPPQPFSVSQPQQPQPAGAIACYQQTDGTNTLNVVARNIGNSSLDYVGPSGSANFDDGTTADTQTLTAGTTLSYKAFNVAPCRSGTLYVLGSTTVNSAKKSFSSNQLTSEYEIPVYRAVRLLITPRSTALADISAQNAFGAASGITQDYVQGTTNQSMGTGSTLTFYVDLVTNESAGAYGSEEGGIWFGVDLVDTTKYSTGSGFSMASTTSGFDVAKITCPATMSNNDKADICYKARSIKTSDPEIRLSATLKSDLGNPTDDGSDDPFIYFEDVQYFRDTDGNIKLDAFDAAGANAGIAQSSLRIHVT